MRLVLGCVLLCALLFGCGKNFDAVPGEEGSLRAHECMWTPSGRSYRIASAGPVMRGAGQSIGVVVSYLSEPLPAAQLESDAAVLVSAFGPEMLLGGEKKLTVEARRPESGTPRAEFQRVEFEPHEGGWKRADATQPSAADGLDGMRRAAQQAQANLQRVGELPVRADPACAEIAPKVQAASDLAWRWVRQLDGGVDTVIQQMSSEFRKQVETAPERWVQVLHERENLGVGARRVELYRMQTKNRSHELGAGDTVLIEYASQPTAAKRVLERVVMVRAKAGWRIDGYAFQPMPDT